MDRQLAILAQNVLAALAIRGQRIVCAESCTAGMIAATLAAVPGASRHFCGSQVVYRNDTKILWLGVPPAILDDPTRGAVCLETAQWMANGVLAKTPEADVALSITGHLGPGAPRGLDGVAVLGWAIRTATGLESRSQHRLLTSSPPDETTPLALQMERRLKRQQEAVAMALLFVLQQLEATSTS